MSTTPNTGLEILTEGQANKEASISEAHQQIDALMQGGVKDRDLAAQPGSPAEGDRYLLPAGATGADWSGQEGRIAHFRNGAWAFITPGEGWRLYVDDEDIMIVYDGTAWSRLGGTINVQETDGTPSVSEVTTVKVGNGDLTDEGGGVVRLKTAADVSLTAFGHQGIWEQIDRQEFSGVSSVTIGGTQTPSDYDVYVLLIFDVLPSFDGARVDIWLSANGGSTKVANYVRMGRNWQSGGTHSDFVDTAATFIAASGIDTVAANKAMSARLEVIAPASANHKLAIWDSAIPADLSSQIMRFFYENYWIEDTGALDSFVIEPDSGTMSGTAVLIGLKKSGTAGRLLEETGTARMLSNDDNDRIIHFTNTGTSVTLTIPDTLPEGFACDVVNETGGAISVSGDGMLNILGDTSIAQNRSARVLLIRNTKASVAAV